MMEYPKKDVSIIKKGGEGQEPRNKIPPSERVEEGDMTDNCLSIDSTYSIEGALDESLPLEVAHNINGVAGALKVFRKHPHLLDDTNFLYSCMTIGHSLSCTTLNGMMKVYYWMSKMKNKDYHWDRYLKVKEVYDERHGGH